MRFNNPIITGFAADPSFVGTMLGIGVIGGKGKSSGVFKYIRIN
ncbi:hypothetical protein [Butyrivibrio sp.]|nr:hypothetical protein [Butyrivibrio sp.]